MLHHRTCRRFLIVFLLAAGGSVQSARAAFVTATLSAPAYDCPEAPVSLIVPATALTSAPSKQDRPLTLCQVEPAGDGQVRLTWIARGLKKGEAQTYYLATNAPSAPGRGVEVKQGGAGLDFVLGGKLFTRYDTTTGPNKPYFYPLNAPGGGQIVRHWPVENVAGETRDHPHHRGLWFTHGALNGTDFWTEGKGTGKTVHTGYEAMQSGPIYGLMRAKTDWLLPNGQKIAEDGREVRVYDLGAGVLMDFFITIKAVGGPLAWGDTKEGTFGLRVADSMRAKLEKSEIARGKVAQGHILSATGAKDAATWGKAAAWCDFSGPIDGRMVGVAIFDHPQNLRHPTMWQVRDYGLFAANPFGLHDFDPKVAPGAGNLTIPEGQSISFRYRLFFHQGTPDAAHVADAWNAFAAPPVAKLGEAK